MKIGATGVAGNMGTADNMKWEGGDIRTVIEGGVILGGKKNPFLNQSLVDSFAINLT